MSLNRIRICAVMLGLASLAISGYIDRDQDDLQTQADNAVSAPIEARAAAAREMRANRVQHQQFTPKAKP